MAKQNEVVKTAELKGVLSKEQKRFNGYLQKIKALKLQNESIQELTIEFGKIVQNKLKPAKEKVTQDLRDFIVSLDKSVFSLDLKGKQAEKHGQILFELADLFLSELNKDEEIIKIFNKYSVENFETIRTEANNEGRDSLIQMFKMQFGVDIDPDDITDLDDPMNNPILFEKIAEAKEKMKQKAEEQAEKKAERDAQKKKSSKQLLEEAQRKSAESAVSKTTKQIYMDLVRNFHPDTEMDEERKIWKTEIMQQITAAYEEDDYIRLLELQMSLLDERENAVSSFDEKQLKFFNDALKNQISELEMKLQMSSPNANPTFPFGHLFDMNPNRLHYNIKQFTKDCQGQEKQYNTWLQMIQTKYGFKEFVKRYEIQEDDMFNMSEMMEIMEMMEGMKRKKW